jgi:hypothetical protein
MEATTTFPSREGLRDNTGALVVSKVTNPPIQYDEVGRTAQDPAAQRVATEGSRPGPQPRAQQRQAAGLPPSRRQEERPPAQDSYYGPRAARAEATALGCEGCGRKGHPAVQCKSFRHPNWNSQHATVPYKNSVIGQAIKRLTNGQLRSLPPNGVQWLPADEVWTGGELLSSWKAKILSPSNRAQTATTAQGHRPDQNKGKTFHLAVVRGGSDVYPSMQGTLTSTSSDASTNCIIVECLLDTGCLFANFVKADIARRLGTHTQSADTKRLVTLADGSLTSM